MAENSNNKETKFESEKDLETVREIYKNMHCMQPDYDKKDSLLFNYYKRINHKPLLFFIAAALIAFTVANSLPYPFIPEEYRFAGVLGAFLVLGILFPLIVYGIRKLSLKNEMAKIKIIEDDLKAYYKNRNLTDKMDFNYTNPRVLKGIIGQLEHKRAFNLKEAVDFSLAEYSKMSAFALQKKENFNKDDIAKFVAAHIDEIK